MFTSSLETNSSLCSTSSAEGLSWLLAATSSSIIALCIKGHHAKFKDIYLTANTKNLKDLTYQIRPKKKTSLFPVAGLKIAMRNAFFFFFFYKS